jgi:hypothetical protein
MYCTYLMLCLTDFVDRSHRTSIGNQLIYACLMLIIGVLAIELTLFSLQVVPRIRNYWRLVKLT